MSRMIDLIRYSAVPGNILHAAARGTLSLPAPEMLEILVELTSVPALSEQAARTLAAWDETSLKHALADPNAPLLVVLYFLSPEGVRPPVLPVLLENDNLADDLLLVLAASESVQVLAVMMQSPRVCKSVILLDALSQNPSMPPGLARLAQEELAALGGTAAVGDPDLLEANKYVIEHRKEIHAAEKEQFHLTGGTSEESAELAEAKKGVSVMAAAAKAISAGEQERGDHERISTLQKIAQMSVGQRVMLALKGSRDDRFILIRDGARVVSQAVLESPKLNESEAESYAGMKNVSENVLRGIAQKRKFAKHYGIVKALTRNPRTPIDVSIPLMKGLQMLDLKGLATNKDIPDAARKVAEKLMRDRMTERNK